MDATTGQNGLFPSARVYLCRRRHRHRAHQARRHGQGGIVVAIVRELGLPIRFVGIGEKIQDLVPFDPQTFVNSLFD